ncbi:MAG: class I SAM-dependent methyltransferase [Methyloligellaceae bacterium]
MGRHSRSVSGTQGYAEDAETLAAKYESVSFAEVHRETLQYFPPPPRQILDIGAGTGRDAAALAAMGHAVLAVEPSSELRRLGQRLHREQTIAWLDDALPELSQVRARGDRFDLVLLSAVWMHLDAEERRAAMPRVAGLVHASGRIIMSLRHGPVPAGRRMFDVSVGETEHLARQSGLCVAHRCERAALLSRSDVRWTCLVLTVDT